MAVQQIVGWPIRKAQLHGQIIDQSVGAQDRAPGIDADEIVAEQADGQQKQDQVAVFLELEDHRIGQWIDHQNRQDGGHQSDPDRAKNQTGYRQERSEHRGS